MKGADEKPDVKIWSLDCIAICTVLGFMFDPKSLGKFCRKFGLGEGTPADVSCQFYLLHRACHEQNGVVPKRLTKLLNERFSETLRMIRALECSTEREIAKRLAGQEVCGSGGILWALLTDPREVFQQYGSYLVHRTSYQAFRDARQQEVEERQEKRQNNQVLKHVAGLQSKCRRQQEKLKECRARIQAVETERNTFKIRCAQQEKKIEQIDAGSGADGKYQRELRMLEHELKQERRRSARLKEAVSVNVAISNPAEIVETPLCELCDDCENACPLNALRVAVVGGLDRLEPRYRQVVEDMGGNFDFHNGDCHGGSQTLKNVVCRSDIIVFVTQLNSHSALHVVKGMCQKTGKRFLALRKTGPQALAEALRQVA